MKENQDVSTDQRAVGCRRFTLRGCLVGLAVSGLLVSIGWYVLMGQAAAPKNSSFEIDLTKIRQMAMERPDRLPLRLNAAVVGEGSYPQVLIMAGSGLKPREMIFAAYQLVYEDQTVVIDSTLPEEDYEKMFPGSPFDSAQYVQLQKALGNSSLILLTHTHPDHIAGISRSPNAAALMPRVFFSQEQFDATSADVGMTDELLALAKTTTYEKYYAPASGIVVIKSPGHSPGDQLIYLRLQDGNEFLLTGDVVWSNENITAATGRPLLFRWLVQEDWQNNGNVIRALHDLAEKETIHMLVSHDGPQLNEYFRQGLVGDGLE